MCPLTLTPKPMLVPQKAAIQRRFAALTVQGSHDATLRHEDGHSAEHSNLGEARYTFVSKGLSDGSSTTFALVWHVESRLALAAKVLDKVCDHLFKRCFAFDCPCSLLWLSFLFMLLISLVDIYSSKGGNCSRLFLNSIHGKSATLRNWVLKERSNYKVNWLLTQKKWDQKREGVALISKLSELRFL